MQIGFSQPQRLIPIFLFVCSALSLQAGEDWPQFRGPHQNGTSTQANLIQSFPADGPKVAWQVPIGPGFSGIAVEGKFLVTQFSDGAEGERKEYVAAYNIKNGKERWRAELGNEFVNQFGNGPRSTPSIAEGKVVALGSYGHLVCLDLKKGNTLWKHDLVGENAETTVPRFGFSTSPLIDNGQVLVDLPGQNEKGYLAVSLVDGSEVWRGIPAGNGYMSPVAVDFNKNRQYIILSGPQLSGIDAKGNVLWQTEWTPGGVANPLVVGDNRVFVSASGDVGGLMVEVDATQTPVAVKEVWRNRAMKNHFNSSVTDGKHIYGFDNATLKCITAADGKTRWAKRGFGKGSLILADNRLWIISDRGDLVAVKAHGEKYEEIGKSPILEGKCWTAPSLAQGLLLARNGTHMTAIRLK
ncbi:PQQ-binding-like beta-propeller repeat protein [Acanthopleuribacter pedis]|uniref:PQQ-like beta-propeller repeat protein n=1 Tax=Acanthopleuribacter pedis TaxID=442870 RepID=A0A8J7QMU6_9BACT|nr:PQQ-binding-like beta-propeller repeat protein [Acanthopleuribacter pedis]MBO1322220.1 PQQ-like beta-propeller repeat protein [Acanthopleuribacter pedis]